MDNNNLQQARLEMAKRELARRQSSGGTGAGGPPPINPSLTETGIGSLPGIKQATQFASGIGSAIGQAGIGLGQAFLKGSQWASNKVLGTQKDIYNPEISQMENIKQNVYVKPFQKELSSIPGKIGEVTGNIAAYVAPSSAISDVTNVATKAANIAKFGKASAAIFRTLAGATAEGAQNYILGYALSGGDTKQAATQALTAGALKGLTAGTGEILKSAGTDEGFMNKIYKSSKVDTESNLFGTGKKSLAQEAIDRGITGNEKQQAVQIQKGLTDSESKIMAEFQKAGNPPIQLNNPQRYIDAIQSRIDLLEKSGATQEAQGLKSSLANISPDGKIPANASLGLRRLLDSMRQSKSFLSQTEELVASQAGLKEMSDSLRSQINSIGGTSGAMKDYQFFISAKNNLINYAKTSTNKSTLDFFDKLILAESVFSHTPVGLGITVGSKAALAAPASTAQAISNLPQSSGFGTAVRSVIGGATAQTTQTQTQGQ